MKIQELLEDARNRDASVYTMQRATWSGSPSVRLFGKTGPTCEVLNWREVSDGWSLTVRVESKKLLNWFKRSAPEFL